ncbi:hypothetical protein Btru_030714 [Bulinus truncatus]|nr:hypothetical protein Btru_030714 [Bulinus truncatus]
MSESDEETAFASADEGDDKKSQSETKNKPKPDGSKTLETSQELPAKEIEKKDTGQQQQKQSQKTKKKGNRSNQANLKEARTGTKLSGKTIPASTSKADVGSNQATSDVKKEKNTSPISVTTEDNKESVEKATADTLVKSKTALQTSEDHVTKESLVQDVVPDTNIGQAQAATEQTTEIEKKSEIVKTPVKQDIPRDKQDEVSQNTEDSAEKNSAGKWGWSSWGSSFLSAATNSVQTFTHQVGDGLSTILDSVESSLGIPEPGELAKENIEDDGQITKDISSEAITSQPEEVKTQGSTSVEPGDENKVVSKEKEKDDSKDSKIFEGSQEEVRKEKSGGGGWFSSWGVSDLAKKVTDTGKSLASKGQTLMAEGFDAVENLAAGGIDVLETIGKKTYNTISEHDPAFRKTREFLSPRSNKPNLSSVLREAKETAESEAEKVKENEEAMKAHFGTLFDDNQGLAHLEALEMLSNQSEKKVHSLLNSLSTKDLAEIKPLLIAIKDTFSIKEDDDSETVPDEDVTGLVSQCLTQLKLGTASDKLNTVLDMVKQWIADFDTQENYEKDTIKEVHQKSIQALAELTAKGVEQFHKAGELILLEKKKENDFAEKAQSLARLTSVLCHEIGNLATRFVACINKMAEKKENTDEVTQFVTNIYLEATNSSTYIQDAFVLLLPVIQHAAIEQLDKKVFFFKHLSILTISECITFCEVCRLL